MKLIYLLSTWETESVLGRQLGLRSKLCGSGFKNFIVLKKIHGTYQLSDSWSYLVDVVSTRSTRWIRQNQQRRAIKRQNERRWVAKQKRACTSYMMGLPNERGCLWWLLGIFVCRRYRSCRDRSQQAIKTTKTEASYKEWSKLDYEVVWRLRLVLNTSMLHCRRGTIIRFKILHIWVHVGSIQDDVKPDIDVTWIIVRPSFI